LKFLISCQGISTRSNESLSTLKKIVVENLYQHDDLAFIFDSAEYSQSEKVLSVNLFSPLVRFDGQKISQELTPSYWYKKHLPAQAERYTDIPPSYFYITRKFLETAKIRGYKLRCVSFTVEEYIFSRTLYSDLIDDFTPFTKDLNKISSAIRCSSAFLATRFHATVFGVTSKVPIFSMSYAHKCTELYKRLGFNDNYIFETMDWVERPGEMNDMFESFISSKIQNEIDPLIVNKNFR
jgi:polysaccharide pyruvyl transferase WcaK-like protein